MIINSEKIKDISRYLAILQYYIQKRNAIGLYNINIESEDLFCGMLNILYDVNLVNLNYAQKNTPSIDLGDEDREICFQITTTNTSQKIKSTLDKFEENKLYNKYSEIYILILGQKSNYKSDFKYDKFNFNKNKNIIDLNDLIVLINQKKDKKVNNIHDYLWKNIKVFDDEGVIDYNEYITTPQYKAGQNYECFMKYSGTNTNDKEEVDRILNDINFFIQRLVDLEINTRTFINLIIEIREKKYKENDYTIFFSRINLRKKIDINSTYFNNEVMLLVQKEIIVPCEDAYEDYDILQIWDKEYDWNILYWVVEFCEKEGKDLKKIIIDLDFTELD